MSLDSHELEQLDLLAAELAQAGFSARATTATLELPDPAFTGKLRLRLVGQERRVSAAPVLIAVPPSRPLEIGEPLFDRRTVGRPFTQPVAVAVASDAEPAQADAGARARPNAGRRWRARQVQPIATTGLPELPNGTEREADRAGHVALLRPSVQWSLPTRIMPARWLAAGLAASIVVAGVLYGTTQLFPNRPFAVAQVAVDATLVHDGSSSPLAQGAELHAGDEVRVAAGGQATLTMGGSFVRMAPDSDVRLDDLASDHLVMEQLAGRAYHRVSLGGSSSYTVVTGSVSWTADGTAFDLDRHSTGSGEEVRGLALFDRVDLTGPELNASLDQGESATVELAADGSPVGSPLIGDIGTAILSDNWLIENARLDRMAGLDLGLLVMVLGTPAPTPQPTPQAGGTAQPAVTAKATPTPTHKSTPVPTRKPTPRPTGPAYLGKLVIVHHSHGSYTFSWPKYTGSGFQYYKLVYGPAGTQPVFDGSNYWACNDSVSDTSWTGSIDIGNYAVRLQVVDESSGIVIRAQTNTVTLKVAAPTPSLPATQNLGALRVTDDGGGKYTFSWSAYTGGWDFDAYKLVYVPWSGNPSYTTGAGYWAATSPGDTSTGSIGVEAGNWSVRVQAIGWPFGGGAYVFGQTSILHLTVAP